MKIVVLQMYGLGNAILTTPLLRALRSMGHDIDVITEKGRAGHLAFANWHTVVNHLWESQAPFDIEYDIALFCHPDGHYARRARYKKKDVIRVPKPKKGRGYMWAFEKHEVLYMVDMARRLGYQGEVPDLRAPTPEAAPEVPQPAVAIGIGYLKDHEAWKKKHWGNERYAALCQALYERGWTPIILGDKKDQADSKEIERLAPCVLNVCGLIPFTQTVGILQGCQAYVGNDSGLMHVAAAVDIPTFGIFQVTNPVKNRPWCRKWVVLQDPTVDEAASQLEETLRDLAGPDDCLHLQERDREPAQGNS